MSSPRAYSGDATTAPSSCVVHPCVSSGAVTGLSDPAGTKFVICGSWPYASHDWVAAGGSVAPSARPASAAKASATTAKIDRRIVAGCYLAASARPVRAPTYDNRVRECGERASPFVERHRREPVSTRTQAALDAWGRGRLTHLHDAGLVEPERGLPWMPKDREPHYTRVARVDHGEVHASSTQANLECCRSCGALEIVE